jgi:hypothetical protein
MAFKLTYTDGQAEDKDKDKDKEDRKYDEGGDDGS